MARILVVSRDYHEGRGLARLLRRDRHRTDMARTDAGAARLLVDHRPDLVVLSLEDPAGALRTMARTIGSGIRRIPAIAIVPQSAAESIDRDTPGLLDLLPTPFSDESFLARVDALLRVKQILFDRTFEANGIVDPETGVFREEARSGPFRHLLEKLHLARPASAAPRRARRRERRPLEPYLETAASMVDSVEVRDALDPGHHERVATLCASIARALGLKEEEIELLVYAASVHDIGKIALSAELLRKPLLTESDRKVMKVHPRRSAELIRALTPYAAAADIVLYHHERPDGQGYYGRQPADVPILAKILAVADVYDGMVSSRSERAPLTPEQAIEALRMGRGVYYDADCVDALAASVHPKRTTVPVSSFPTPLSPRKSH